MKYFLLIISYFLLRFDVKIMCQDIDKCNGDVNSCVQIKANISQAYPTSSLNVTNPKSAVRKYSSRYHRKHKHSSRRKNTQRKVHRHSTRVLSLKPAVILLPPFENINKEKNISTVNPFIINILANPMNELSTKHLNFKSKEPNSQKNSLNNTVSSIKSVTETSPKPISIFDSYNNTNLEHVHNPIIIYPPEMNTFTEHEGSTANGFFSNSEVNSVPINEIEPPISTVPPPFYLLLPPLVERDNTLDSQQLEKPSIFQLPTLTDDEYVEVNNSFLNYQQNASFSSHLKSEKEVTRWDNNSFLLFNTLFIPIIDYFSNLTMANSHVAFEEKGQNEENNSYNNTLLAPEIASLGMKIVTSKKGLRMIEKLTETKLSTKPPQTDETQSILETAESGDIRSHAYNQILSIEDSKDLPKEMYKALKKPYKPSEICKHSLGYVADPSSGCQVFYICLGRGAGEPMMCPNGTLFNQEVLVCDWWYNVECNG